MADSSDDWFARAEEVMPGGVSSPVRAFRSVGDTPRFVANAHGSRITDTDGREYVDLVGAWGPMILGHAHPEVVAAAFHEIRAGPAEVAGCFPVGAEQQHPPVVNSIAGPDPAADSVN